MLTIHSAQWIKDSFVNIIWENLWMQFKTKQLGGKEHGICMDEMVHKSYRSCVQLLTHIFSSFSGLALVGSGLQVWLRIEDEAHCYVSSASLQASCFSRLRKWPPRCLSGGCRPACWARTKREQRAVDAASAKPALQSCGSTSSFPRETGSLL